MASALPKLPKKARPEKLTKPRTFWLTDDMDHKIDRLQELRGKNDVIEWLRSCWKCALDQAIADAKSELPEFNAEDVGLSPSNLDHAYEY